MSQALNAKRAAVAQRLAYLLLAAVSSFGPLPNAARSQNITQTPSSGAFAATPTSATPQVATPAPGKSQAEITQQLEQLDQIAKGFVEDANKLLVDQQQLSFELRRGARALEEGCKTAKRPDPALPSTASPDLAKSMTAKARSVDPMVPVAGRVRDMQARLTNAEQAQCATVARMKGASLENCGSLSIMGQWSNHAVRLLALRQQQLSERAQMLDLVTQLEKAQCVSEGFSGKLVKQIDSQSARLDDRTEQLLGRFLRAGSEVAARPSQARQPGS